MSIPVNTIVNEIDRRPEYEIYGRVTAVVGLMVEIGGVQGHLSIGDHCSITGKGGRRTLCEVVGFRHGRALVMPFGSVEGIGLGCRADVGANDPVIHPGPGWLGRVVNAFG